METNDTIAVVILVAIGLAGGIFISRKSERSEKVYGGAVGRVTHYLASALVIAMAPTVLCSVFFIHPEFLGKITLFGLNLTAFVHALLIAAAMVLVALGLLLIHAIAARPQLDRVVPEKDRGWTAEDARKSGL
jgi:hypothetical protein